jgi:hypothetical protein
MKHAGWILVHGRTRGQLEPIGHAWLVSACGAWIYDPVLDRDYQADVYAAHFDAVEERRFPTAKVVAEMALKHGHWGPW